MITEPTPTTTITATDAERSHLHAHSHSMVNMLREQAHKALEAFRFDGKGHTKTVIDYVADGYRLTLATNGTNSTNKALHSYQAYELFNLPMKLIGNLNSMVQNIAPNSKDIAALKPLAKSLAQHSETLDIAMMHYEQCALTPYIDGLNDPSEKEYYPGTADEDYKKTNKPETIKRFALQDFKIHAAERLPVAQEAITDFRNFLENARSTIAPTEASTKLLGIYSNLLSVMEETLERTYRTANKQPVTAEPGRA